MGGPIPSLASGNSSCTACAMTCAVEWRRMLRPSALSMLMGSSSSSADTSRERSLRAPLTLAAMTSGLSAKSSHARVTGTVITLHDLGGPYGWVALLGQAYRRGQRSERTLDLAGLLGEVEVVTAGALVARAGAAREHVRAGLAEQSIVAGFAKELVVARSGPAPRPNRRPRAPRRSTRPAPHRRAPVAPPRVR